MENNAVNSKNCSRCNNTKTIDNFISEAGRVLKMCSRCRNIGRKQNQNNKCEHNRIKCRCIDCGGVGICEHNRIKQTCKDCGGVGICEHNRIKQKCKDCGGIGICEHGKQKQKCKKCSNPTKITIMNMIHHSKENDIKYNRYDANNFIDKCFIEMLMNESLNCHYCNIEMQLIEYNDTLVTIERLNNSLGHIKSNCVLACRSCNLKKVGQKA
jgi:hypothetical protein